MLTTNAHLFLPEIVNALVPEGLPGAYVLGELEGGEFVPKYVGRSDVNLRARLATHNYLYTFSYFAFVPLETPKQAYLTEDKWWHDCHANGIDIVNKIHPDTPDGMAATCPYCEYAVVTLPSIEQLGHPAA